MANRWCSSRSNTATPSGISTESWRLPAWTASASAPSTSPPLTEIAAAIDLVREKTLAAGLLLGGFCPDPEFWGTRFLHWKALSTDTDALFRAYRSMLQSQRSIQEEE